MKMWIFLLFSLSMVYSGTAQQFPNKTKMLYIGGIFPMEGPWAGGKGCRPAVDMALDDINARLDIIPGYHLEMVANDSQCMPGLGMNVMYDLLYNEPTKLVLLGPGCSLVSTFVGQAARMWNLVVLSYGSSAPLLSDRRRFPTFFRTHPSATLHNPTRIRLFQKYKWTRIATIQETEEPFPSTMEDLEERAKNAGIEIAVRTSFLTDPTDAVRNLKRQDARIIVGLFYEDMARRVFCEVYKQGLYGPKRVWFIIGWYADNWYAVPDDSINCTAEQMKEALEGHFTTEGQMLYNGKDRTLSNLTAQEFMSKVEDKLEDSPLDVTGYVESPLAYDAVWALALALNKTQAKLAKENKLLEDFNYSRKDIMDEIYSAMNSTNFLGVSGRVLFDSDGSRIALTQVEQMTDGNYTKLGYYDIVTEKFTEWYSNEKWPGDLIPQDQVIVTEEIRVISLGLFIAMSLLASLGIIIATILLIFNINHRNRRYIALSQPHINSLMLVGCIICLSCVILEGLDHRFLKADGFVLLCQAKAVVLTIGFTFAYGPMFAKVWTIYRLTTRRKKEIKPFRDWEMYVVVLIFLLVDVIVLTALHVIDPLHGDFETFPHEIKENTDRDEEIKPLLQHCTSQNIKIWLGVLFGYKGVMLLFGLLLAYETRNMKIKQINDCRFVGMSIYNVVVLCLITAPVTLIISAHQDASYAFVAVAILLSCFLAMGLIFVPKVLEATHNRDSFNVSSLSDNLHSREDETRYQQLLVENDDIKRQIVEKEEKILELKRRLDHKTVHAHVTFHSSCHGNETNNSQSGSKSVCIVDPLSGTTTHSSEHLHPQQTVKPYSGGGILKNSPRVAKKLQNNTNVNLLSNPEDVDSSPAANLAGIQLTVMNTNYRPAGDSPPEQRTRKKLSFLGAVEPSIDSGVPSSVYSSSNATKSSRILEDLYSDEYC